MSHRDGVSPLPQRSNSRHPQPNRNLRLESPGTKGLVADLKGPENRAALENKIQDALMLENLPPVIIEGLEKPPNPATDAPLKEGLDANQRYMEVGQAMAMLSRLEHILANCALLLPG